MATTGLHIELHSLEARFSPMTKSFGVQQLLRKFGGGLAIPPPLGITRVNSAGLQLLVLACFAAGHFVLSKFTTVHHIRPVHSR
jgi:hypothetical protein